MFALSLKSGTVKLDVEDSVNASPLISKSVTPQGSARATAEVAEKARRTQSNADPLRPLRLLRGSPCNSRGRAFARSPAWVPAFAGMSGFEERRRRVLLLRR